MKKNLHALWLLFCQTAVALVALMLVWQAFRQPPPTASYRDTLAQVLPSVVGVYGRQLSELPNPNDSIGSGVIIDGGHVLTNYHLIANMGGIEVKIAERRYTADVVGIDPEIDIAVLRISANPSDLPAIVFADDSNLRQGDVVFAVGNPFGLSRSASMGIVSAIGRSELGINRQENFIQTDAAINPGSSGGALANVRGELVGINSALFARSPSGGGAPQGIGFAVPAGIIRHSLDDFLPPHRQTNNPLGAEVRPMSSHLHGEILDFTPEYTPVMLVSRVWRGTPAAALGLLPGDIVLLVNNGSTRELSETGVLPLSLHSITVLRAGERRRLQLPSAPE